MADSEAESHFLSVDNQVRATRLGADIRPLVTHFGDIWRASIEDKVVETFPGGSINDLLVSSPNNWRIGIITAHTEIMEQLKR
jgi:hypothetical protein